MLKRLYFMRLLKGMALLVPIVAMVLFLQSFLFYHSDYSTERLRDFYKEEPHSLDVVILGASEIYNDYLPVYAYEYSGLTSYMYAFGSNPDSLYLTELKEILSRQDPQLLLIEVEGFLHHQLSSLNDESNLRTLVENIPLSPNSLRAIYDYPYEDKLSCIVPFFKYHGEWTTPLADLVQRLRYRASTMGKPSFLKGAFTFTAANNAWPEYDVLGDTTTHDLFPRSEAYLVELLEYCKALHTDKVAFIRFPHKIVDEERYIRFARANRVGQIVEEYGFPFFDLEQCTEDMILDFEADFYDNEHMNIYGQLKLTEYLSNLFMDEFGLEPMEQTPENQQRWDDCIPYVNAYIEAVYERMDTMKVEKVYERPRRFIDEMEERIAAWDE